MDNTFEYINYEHAEILVFEKYIIKQIKEGQTIKPKHAEVLKDLIDSHYGDKPFIYISNRTNSYSVNPLSYKVAEKIPNLKGIAIVTTEDNFDHAAFESTFFKKPFAIFKDLTKAIAWVNEVLNQDYIAQRKIGT